MTTHAWAAPPDELGKFEAAVVLCIPGEVTTDTLKAATGAAGLDLLDRMDALMDKHFATSADALAHMTRTQRHGIANGILSAELDDRGTMPGALVPLRTLRQT